MRVVGGMESRRLARAEFGWEPSRLAGAEAWAGVDRRGVHDGACGWGWGWGPVRGSLVVAPGSLGRGPEGWGTERRRWRGG